MCFHTEQVDSTVHWVYGASQITMTTGWLLLLLALSSQSVDSQSTTDDEACDTVRLSELQRHMSALKSDMQRLQNNQQQLLGKSQQNVILNLRCFTEDQYNKTKKKQPIMPC